jgi:hypothetical protein
MPKNRLDSFGNQYITGSYDEVSMSTGSLSLDTTSQYLSITSSAGGTLDLTNKTVFTIEGWIYLSSYNSGESAIISNRDSGSTGGFDLRVNTSNQLQFYYTGGSSLTTSSTLSLNTWYHVAAVRNSANFYLFIDGVLSATSASFANGTTVSQKISIGRSQDDTTTTLNGYMTNIRVLSGTALYTVSFTPPTVPLENITNTVLLLKCTDASTYTTDSSSIPQTVTNNGNVGFNYQSVFNDTPCGSIFFNSSSKYLSTPAVSSLTTWTGDFTVEAWIYPSDTGLSYWGVWDSRQAGASNDSTILRISPLASPVSGQGRMTYFNGTYYYGTTTVYWNTWTHVAWVRSGTTLTFYVNGVAGGTATISGTQTGTATSNPVVVGTKDSPYGSYGTTGYMTNFRLVNGTAVYTGNFTPPSLVLPSITNTALLLKAANSSTFTTDSSPNAYTITNNGTSVYRQFAPITSVRQKVTSDGSILVDNVIDEMTLSTGSFLISGSNNVSATSSVFTYTGDFTVEGWVYPSSNTDGPEIAIGTEATNRIDFFANTTAANYNIFGSSNVSLGTSSLIAGRWNHFAFTRSGSTIKAFFNGTNTTATGTQSGTLGNGAARIFTLGSGSSFFSNLRIVGGSALYTSAFTPPTLPLENIANTSLLLKSSNTSTYLTDSSTNQLAISNTGITLFNYQSPFNDAPCGSISFNGSSQYLNVANNAALYASTSDFTTEAWVLLNAVDSTQRRFFSQQAPGSSTVYWVGVSTTNKFTSEIRGSGGAGDTQIYGTTTPVVGTWYHVAFTRSGTNTYLFVNGILEASSTGQNQSIGTSSTGIGAYYNPGGLSSPGEYWNGYITNLRHIVGTAVYTRNFTPPSTVLQPITNTQLLLQVANQPTAIIDSSTNAFTVTNNGTAVYKQFAPLTASKQRLDVTGTHYVANTYDEVSLNNGSVYFANSSYAYTATMPSLNSNNFTIECWVNQSAYATESPLVKYIQTDIIEIRLVNGKLTPYFNSGTAATGGGSVLANNVWYHVALVRNGTTLTQYLNGVANGTATISGTSNATAVYIGRNQTAGGSSFNGSMAKLRISNTAIYTTDFTPTTQPYVANSSTQLLMFNEANTTNYNLNFGNSTITPANVGIVPFNYQSPNNDQPCGSLSFNGSNQYLTVPTPLVAATGPFTVEAWIYTTASAIQLIYTQYLSSNANRTQFLTIGSPGGPLSFAVGSPAVATGATNVPLNQWVHVAATRDNSNVLRLFLNGRVDATNSSFTATLGLDNPRISGFNGVGTYNFSGFITNFRTANTCLYTADFTPSTTVLQSVANTTFLLKAANTAAYITDSGPNAYTVTNNGTVLYKQFAPLAN